MSSSYTIAYFIRTIESIPVRQIITSNQVGSKKCKTIEQHLANKTTGLYSVKQEKLSEFLDGYALAIADGGAHFNKLGKTPRTRLLTALKLRKDGNFTIALYLKY